MGAHCSALLSRGLSFQIAQSLAPIYLSMHLKAFKIIKLSTYTKGDLY